MATPPRTTVATFLLIPVIGEIQPYYAPLLGVAFNSISQAITRFFDEPFEHVFVLYGGHPRDMFVGETSSINGRHIRNVRATDIYRANFVHSQYHHVSWMPGEILMPDFRYTRREILESAPAICGPAVLFPDTIVWR
ncbi:conserved hypothetical protein [uncultured Pleomorphomonas sp.]|uniref:Uncharacterized protein n=1 Tax=uncultured Pleomorphomonas sp. TaxID=442121 RepID=A0A212LQU7_9HYPH|nr:hypothetical protein [uncultured Pleomorphomonas sp.]SCM79892.1 conserved hypothetical protein [uncultured Pleomorphomonas sp.]